MFSCLTFTHLTLCKLLLTFYCWLHRSNSALNCTDAVASVTVVMSVVSYVPESSFQTHLQRLISRVPLQGDILNTETRRVLGARIHILEIKEEMIHRIVEWFGLEGPLKIIWFQPLCHGQGHLPLDQVSQSPIQPSTLPGRGQPQLLWACCSSVSPPS